MRDIVIGNNIRRARMLAEYTQQELAEQVSVTRQTISLIEADKYNPSLKLCLMLAHVLNKKLDDLFWIASLGENDNEMG